MTMVVAGRIDIKTRQARKDISATKKEFRDLGIAVKGSNAEMHAGLPIARNVERTHRLAGGSVANMTAQFNDLGVMMAAGQNPLQLAMQQGTQITQILGPMGAAGAARTLGAAFMGMVNPFTVSTLAIIAGTSALSNWIFHGEKAEDKALTFTEKLDKMTKALDEYKKAQTLPNNENKILEEYGEVNDELRETLRLLEEVARRNAERTLQGTIGGLVNFQPEGEKKPKFDLTTDKGIRDLFGLETEPLNEKATRTRQNPQGKGALTPIGELFDEIKTYAALLKDGTRDAEKQLETLSKMRPIAEELGARGKENSKEQNEFLKALGESYTATHTFLNEKNRLDAIAKKAGEERLADMAQENRLAALALKHGKDSLQVVLARQAAEREAFAKSLNESGGANAGHPVIGQGSPALQAVHDELRTAFYEAQRLERIELFGDIPLEKLEKMNTELHRASNSVAQLAEKNNVSFTRAQQMLAEGYREDVIFDPRDPRYDAGRAKSASRKDRLKALNKPKDDKPDKPRKATTLQQALEKELAILRATDPAQKEIIQNQEALATATDTERAAIEGLIQTKHRELEATRKSAEQKQAWGQMTLAAIKDADGALDMLANSLLQGIWMGGGPFGNMFGLGGQGLFGNLFGGFFADGGMIYGAGGPRDDRQLVLASPGEYIVNAQATAQNRALLDAINAGARPPSFATGGAVGGAPSAPAGGAGGNVEIHVHVEGAAGDAQIVELVRKGVEEGVRHYDKEILPRSVARINKNPERVG